MVFSIADFYFDLQNPPRHIRENYKEYICENAPYIDAEIKISNKDLLFEKELALANGEKEMGIASWYSFAFCRKVCSFALSKAAFLMHGVLLEYEGKGYLFTAKSGTGKTTHALQWKKTFGDDKVTIVNGDKPIIRFVDGKVYAYGTPWNGKEHYGTTGRVELKAICFVTRGEPNEIHSISADEVVPLLFSQIMITDSANLAKQLELVDTLLEKVPMYRLRCNVSEEAAMVAYRGMNE